MLTEAAANNTVSIPFRNILVIEENHFLREKISGVLSRFDFVDLVAQIANPDYISKKHITFEPDLILLGIISAGSKHDSYRIVLQMFPGATVALVLEHTEEIYQKAAAGLGIAHLVSTTNLISDIRNLARTHTGRMDRTAARETGLL